jgi:hypothetical protein
MKISSQIDPFLGRKLILKNTFFPKTGFSEDFPGQTERLGRLKYLEKIHLLVLYLH